MILLDTHVAVWMTTDKSRLSMPAATAIRAAAREGTGVAISGSTLWEMALMSSRKQLRMRGTATDYLRHVESVFVVLPVTGAIAERSMLFTKRFPHDPTDRIIGATALVHGLQLVTKDEEIRASGEVPVVW
jgi:PIN domain nuclease of toxin-antitoxin system